MAGGERMLILSDRDLPDGTMAIPALLAVSAVNRHLLNASRRTSASLIVETGEAREVMHMALLLGYGASAINPYLAFEIVADLALRNRLSKDVGVDQGPGELHQGPLQGPAQDHVEDGHLHPAQLPQRPGVRGRGPQPRGGRPYFEGTASRIEGIGLDEIAARGPGALPGGP